MEWVESIGKAISFIEENITEEITIEDIAREVSISPFYFQKGFAMLCGYTVNDYIRQRRLSLAGSEVLSSDEKVIDIAVKYGYDSPDSFTKAFTRFHNATPTAVRKNGAMIKSFASLKIIFSLEGGYIMDYKIVEKDSFTVIGVSKRFKYPGAQDEIPQFWTEHYQSGRGAVVCGLYGICIEGDPDSDEFEYLIADNYVPAGEIPDGYITKVIPKFTWAVFACRGAMPQAIQEMNHKIFSEWLPNCKDYEITSGYNIEMYDSMTSYKKGNQDENYYSEIWIPVQKK